MAIRRSVIQRALTALPPPVSMSAMTGMFTACAMFQVMSSTSFIWIRPTSGLPRTDAATPYPEIWMASKPHFSMTLAEKASWQPTTATARRSMMALRSTVVLFIASSSGKTGYSGGRTRQKPTGSLPSVRLAALWVTGGRPARRGRRAAQ